MSRQAILWINSWLNANKCTVLSRIIQLVSFFFEKIKKWFIFLGICKLRWTRGLNMVALLCFLLRVLFKMLQLGKVNLSHQAINLPKHGELVSYPNNWFLINNWLFSENNGEQDWPSGCSLQYVSGDKLTNQTQIPVPPLPAMAQTDGKFITRVCHVVFQSASWIRLI